MGRVWVGLGELGEILDFDLEREMICWGFWGGEVCDWIGRGSMGMERNGFGVGFWVM